MFSVTWAVNVAEDVKRLGYEVAGEILRTAMPQTAKGRSGDLGEILATELVEEEIGLRVPVRRLRYKDGRNMAMRGDDFIGAGYDGAGEKLWLLKGEAKSNKVLGKGTVTSARKVLNRDSGRCTPDSLLFVANRLLESNDPNDNALGRDLRDEVGLKTSISRQAKQRSVTCSCAISAGCAASFASGWVSDEDVAKIGPQNMRAVEEAFTYRLVWALEAVRTRRMSLGWSPETVAGSAAAVIETGVPQFMMAMLIRAGLPSRRAAMAAVEDAKPVFVTPAEMRAWLESDEITAYTDAGDWPTPDTAALWARFRTEALSGGIQKWSVERYKRLLDIAAAPPAGLYRIVTDEGDGRTWLTTPDYQQIAAFKKPAVDPKPSLFSGRL